MNILLRTSEHRGDHDADVTRAYVYIAGETVEDLVKRISPRHTDVIELRIELSPAKEDRDLPF